MVELSIIDDITTESTETKMKMNNLVVAIEHDGTKFQGSQTNKHQNSTRCF